MLRALLISTLTMAPSLAAAERVLECGSGYTLDTGERFITSGLTVMEDRSGHVSLEATYFENDVYLHPDGTSSYDIMFEQTTESNFTIGGADRYTTVLTANIVQDGYLLPTIWVVDWVENTVETVNVDSPNTAGASNLRVAPFGDCERVQ